MGNLSYILFCWELGINFLFSSLIRYNRVETVAAFFNGVFLVLISCSIVIEAIQRLIHPPEMSTQRLLLVSFVGLLVNLVGIFAFNHGHAHGGHGHDHHHHGHDHGHGHSANMQGVFLHIMADTLGSVGVIVSTLLIQWFGWTGFDPIASLFIAVLIVLSVIPLIRQSASVLMLQLGDHTVNQVEGTVNEAKQFEGVVDVLLARFWPNEAETVVGSLHVLIDDNADSQDVRRKVSDTFMSHVEGLKEICVQVDRASNQKLKNHSHNNNNTLYNHHHHQPTHNGFFSPATPPYSNNNGVNQMNFRNTAIPQPTFADPAMKPSIMSVKKKD
jgi:zinc transporter 5/7